MTDCKRTGKRWTTPEVLNLQREYELLNLSVEEIADKHQRSVNSILFKLHAEGLTSAFEYSNVNNIPTFTTISANVNKAKAKAKAKDLDDLLSDTDSSSDFVDDDDVSEYNSDDDECLECNINTLSDRVWSLETSVEEINTMMKEMFSQMTTQNKSKKLAPLRNSSTCKKSGV